MAVTLRYLCENAKENYGMDLICGESNMSNPVSWVHMLEDPDAASFLRGRELIFSTGIGHENTDWLPAFAKRLASIRASGLVLNIGPYIRSVPEEVIAFCKEVQFPLFTLPWKTRIVDITNDFCREIIKSEENEVTVAVAFRNAIFFPDNAAGGRPVLERNEYDPDAEFLVAAISLHAPSEDRLRELDKSVGLNLAKILYDYNGRFSVFRQDKYLIAVMQGFPQNAAEASFRKLIDACRPADGSCGVRVGVGINDSGVKSLPKNYKRAAALLHMAERQDKTLVACRDTGLYRLLLEVDDPGALRWFYEDTLKRLEDYDSKYRTDYLDTLKSYLDNNASVQEVARGAYVHRNTINHKIKRIKEILGCELTYQDGLRLLMAFYIRDML